MKPVHSRIFLLFLLVAQCICGSAQQVIPLYEGLPPGATSRDVKEVFSRPENGRPTVKNVTRPALTVYLPQDQNAIHSAVIICPGGGYLNLSIEDGGYDVARSLAGNGIAAFVLKYRTWVDSAYTNYSDVPMQDLQQAMRIVYSNAGQWHIDTTRIGWLGFSAGGHLVAWSTTSGAGKKPAFTMLIYPVISFTDALTSRTSKTRGTLIGKDPSQSLKEKYSPELHVSAQTPPAFIVQAEDDSTSLVGNSVAYYKALVEKKVPAQLLLYQKGGHGFAMYNKAQNTSWMPQALEWLALNGFYKPPAAGKAMAIAPPFWNDILAFRKLDSVSPPPAHPILFVGSSSFTRWKDLAKDFPGYPVLNRGFGGSTLPDVIRYVYDVIIPYQPKQVVIYCGENDLASADSITAGEVVNRFKTLYGMIRQNLPGATISFVSIKPSPVRAKIQSRVKEANRQIRSFLATQKKTQFIDIYNDMLTTDGKMREELYVEDRLHMKPEGYEIWRKKMTPYLLK